MSATAALIVWTAVAATAAQPADPAQAHGIDRVGSSRLLDVPYLTQTEDLCGGAALAMVLRYWGERQVYPEDFAPLVDRSASGIRTDVLAAEVSRRGWQSFPFSADAHASGEWIRQHIDRARPVVALIEVRPDRYHYVVIVAWTGDEVVAHDPARAPYRVMSTAEFDRVWARAGRWALLVLPLNGPPSEARAPSASSATETRSASGMCGPLVAEMVQRARTGDIDGAEAGLQAAVRLCPRDPAAWRELAGVRFLQSNWADASEFAERAARLDPGDEPGWDLLATSRYLDDEPEAALLAWNRIDRPTVDLVRVTGARRTRDPAIAALVDLPTRTLLTPHAFGRAARRLQEMPSAAVTRLRYQPVEGGLVEIEAAVVERPIVPQGLATIAARAARSVIQRELGLEVAAPAESGELWTLAWRWWAARPRVDAAVAMPAATWLPGVVTIEGSWERSSYAAPPAAGGEGPSLARDARRRAAVRLADWATPNLRWAAGVGLDRWGRASHASVDVVVDLRLVGDRVSVAFEASGWTPGGVGARFGRAGLSSAWRSSRDAGEARWLAWGGVTAASRNAPLDLWAGAGTGQARVPLLRAHPLLTDGVVDGPVFGRRLAHGTFEYHRPGPTSLRRALQFAAFADTARAWRRLGDIEPSRWHTDVGAGVRVALPGQGGTARVDVARGLRDGRLVVSAGWQSAWPGR